MYKTTKIYNYYTFFSFPGCNIDYLVMIYGISAPKNYIIQYSLERMRELIVYYMKVLSNLHYFAFDVTAVK